MGYPIPKMTVVCLTRKYEPTGGHRNLANCRDCIMSVSASRSYQDTGASSRSLRGGERGALLVEFAFVAPVLIMFVLGTITMGLSYNRSISLNNSARESARYGATLPVADDLEGWLNSVADVARDAAAGDLSASAPGQSICVSFVHTNGTDIHDRTLTVIETSGNRVVIAGVTCFEDGRGSDERRVQVSMQRNSDVTTAVFTSDGVLSAQSVARFERA